MKNILLLTDNDELLHRFIDILKQKGLDKNHRYTFRYAFSPKNAAFLSKFAEAEWIAPLDVNQESAHLSNAYDLIFSLHSRQIFPESLVNRVKCINIHPGLNPHNRGWFPQVFSIINALPCGATIHEMDAQLDHGPVICQKEVKIEMWDTSITAYKKILDAEMELLSQHLEHILEGNYKTTTAGNGNLNLKKDFDDLCHIDLNDSDTFRNHINKLRALTHGNYANAYFLDEKGHKIYVKLELTRE